MAEKVSPGRFKRFLWRRGPLLLSIAVFVAVRLQIDSWLWALVASLLIYPLLPLGAGAFLVARDSRRPEPVPDFIRIPDVADDEPSRASLTVIREARDALHGSGTARIEFIRHVEVGDPNFGRGPLGRGLTRIVDKFRHQVGEGVVDLPRQRMMLDYGHFAETQLGARGYAGPSGGDLKPGESEADDRFENQPSPLWFLAALDCAVRASQGGDDDIDGAGCHRFEVILDLSSFTPSERSPAWVPPWPDPTRVPMLVWLDGAALRRLRYQEIESTTYTLSIRDIGLDISALDWTRFGTFRTLEGRISAQTNAI